MSNARKDETLGMPHGTANGRLRKIILFDLLKRHKENICVRCNSSIENIDELSIEHILGWEGVSAELFWDLGNIAFSHMSCNLASRRLPTAQPLLRKIGPEGTSWCTTCKIFHSIDMFSKDAARWNGLRAICREKMKVYKEKYHSTVGLKV